MAEPLTIETSEGILDEDIYLDTNVVRNNQSLRSLRSAERNNEGVRRLFDTITRCRYLFYRNDALAVQVFKDLRL